MASRSCPTCQRSEADLHPRCGQSKSREVTLANIHKTALNCKVCSFVQEILARDATTPEEGGSFYESAKVRVDDNGLRFTGQWQGALVTEIYAPGNEPKIPTPINIPRDVTCDLAANIVNGWLQSCQEHTECNSHNFFATKERGSQDFGEGAAREIGFDSSLPKRMIRLGENVVTAQLVQTPTNPTVPYAALSYCWGGNGTFKTEKHTVKEYEKEIQLERLPKTIKDALCLTKKIGLSYIWVDAICIIQGDKEEWDQESQKMGYIYSNAKIIISATRSKNVLEGLFNPRPATPLSEDIVAIGGSMRARRNLNHEIIISCRTKSNYWWEKHINTSFPLLSRGWGFQERMLATRIVHFTPSELVWECQTIRTCECRVMESNLYPVMNNMASAFRVYLKKPNDKRSMRQIWREIVYSYSLRKLTLIEDKLPAISGIASLLKEKSGDTYVAGLWKSSLPFDLLWRCDQSVDLQRSKTRSPSWSWISVDGAIKWPVAQLETDEQPLIYITSTTYFECRSSGVKVVNLDIELDAEDEHGRVKSARMKLETRLTPATIKRFADETWNGVYGTEWAVQVAGSHQAPFWPDLNQEGLHCGPFQNHGLDEFYLMEVMKSGNIPGSWEEALVVRLKCASGIEYERVGVAANVEPKSEKWTTVKSWFDYSDLKEVILV